MRHCSDVRTPLLACSVDAHGAPILSRRPVAHRTPMQGLDLRAVLRLYGAISALRSPRVVTALVSASERLLMTVTVSAGGARGVRGGKGDWPLVTARERCRWCCG